MHGGALGAGAPRDNKNALKHGFYTRKVKDEQRNIRALLRHSRDLIQQVK
jgi:uncharacterized protein YjcR